MTERALRRRVGHWAGQLVAASLLACCLGPSAASQARSAPGANRNDQLTSLVVKVNTGVTLNYVVQGDEKGPVIVLLHGAGDSWHSYDRIFPLLPSRFRVYAITLRGHGISDHPATGYSRSDFASDVLAFLDQFHLQHVTLVGHSLGSFVAQVVTERDNGHVDRLVLIGSGPPVRRAGSSSSGLKNYFASVQDPVPYTFARDFQASTIYAPVPAWFFETMVGEAQRVPAATWHGLGSNVDESLSMDDLKKIRVPTLVLWGEKDSIFHREDEDTLVKNLPHASFSAYAETGHALHWERPERFTKELLGFIAAHP